MSYDDALAALQRALSFGMNPSLDGITALCEALGRPQDRFAVVQVTGTNGKTSTTRLTAALLRGEGMRVGLFTSPHLERYNERIEIDGAPVSDADFALALEATLAGGRRAAARPSVPGTPAGFTEFELLTAAALWLFRERGVEIAVLEVGLGGRWDATSVVNPSVAVITGVGLDHTAILGDTLEAIAAEKAAIIRPASAPVLGPGTDGLDSIFLRAADAASTHARAVREDLDFSPVPEELTVRFRVVERPSSPDGHTLVSVDGVHAHYPALALSGPRVPGRQHRDGGRRRRGGSRPSAARRARSGRAARLDAPRPLRARARRPAGHRRWLAQPAGGRDARRGHPRRVPRPDRASAASARHPRRQGRARHRRGAGAGRRWYRRHAVGLASRHAGRGAGRARDRGDRGAADALCSRAVAEALDVLLATAHDGLVVTGSITTAGEARALLRNT